jgi:general secretion pathway protein K
MGAVRGVALVQVLLILVILALISSNIQFQQRRDIDRTYNQLRTGQAREYLISGEEIARQGLKLDKDNSQIDDLTELWNQPVGPFPLGVGREGELESGAIMMSLQDLNGKFNLNWLSDQNADASVWQGRFQRLLSALGISTEVAEQLRAWFNKDSGIDYQYANLEQPYLPSSQPMAHVSELMLIQGMERNSFEKIRPYITALPATSLLNINTAPAEVLRGLTDVLADSTIDRLISEREAEPFQSLDDMINRLQLTDKERDNLPNDKLVAVSEYFELFSEVELGNQLAHMTSVIHRANDGTLNIVARDLAARKQYRIDTTAPDSL